MIISVVTFAVPASLLQIELQYSALQQLVIRNAITIQWLTT